MEFVVLLGAYLSSRDVELSWLWPQQQVSDSITPLYDIYTKCFGSLIWCEWACGSTLRTGLLSVGDRLLFGVLGVDLSLSDVVMSWLRLQQASDWNITSILDVIQSVLTP